MLFQTILCASFLLPPALVAARPYTNPPENSGTWTSSANWASPTRASPTPTQIPGGYTLYRGDGSTAAGWPPMSSWLAFEGMWNGVQTFISNSCAQFGVSNPSGQEASQIHDYVLQLSRQTGVDPRFILAIIMEESGGCVRVPTTAGQVRNPGLMQSHNGNGTCNSDITHSVSDPCPGSEILQMISDGVAGTSNGGGLSTILNQAQGADSQAFYRAARIYNSGSVAGSGNLEDGAATHCYASDVANWLTGWNGSPKVCSLG